MLMRCFICLAVVQMTVHAGAGDTGGVLEGATHWTVEDGPYFITSDLIVPRDGHAYRGCRSANQHGRGDRNYRAGNSCL